MVDWWSWAGSAGGLGEAAAGRLGILAVELDADEAAVEPETGHAGSPMASGKVEAKLG